VLYLQDKRDWVREIFPHFTVHIGTNYIFSLITWPLTQGHIGNYR